MPSFYVEVRTILASDLDRYPALRCYSLPYPAVLNPDLRARSFARRRTSESQPVRPPRTAKLQGSPKPGTAARKTRASP
jgi:hypothetical protein